MAQRVDNPVASVSIPKNVLEPIEDLIDSINVLIKQIEGDHCA